jgi:hypothetical protein
LLLVAGYWDSPKYCRYPLKLKDYNEGIGK